MQETQPISNNSYVGTTYAAKMLQISVGTIQKMVRTGELPAYITSGGHRRIPYAAVVACMKKNSVNSDGVQAGARNKGIDQICVLHSSKQRSPQLEKIAQDGSFQVITDPMNLLKPAARMVHIFMDARIEWANWAQMEPSTNALIHYVIYNSSVLSEDERMHLESFAVLLDTDISLELLYGYRLGFQSNAIEASTLSYPNMVKQ